MTGVVPDGYESYVRILHPVVYGHRDLRWRDVAAVTGRQVHPLVQWWRLIDADEPLNPVSSLWDGDPPETGELLSPVAAVVYQLLATRTATPATTYFGFWTGYAGNNGTDTWSAAARAVSRITDDSMPQRRTCGSPQDLELPGREYGLLVGSLRDAPLIADYLEQNASGPMSPNVMWPNDREWFLASEIDLDSTLVACSASTAHDITSCDQIEAYVVDPHDSLQADADKVNP